jgi:hypothetical protein
MPRAPPTFSEITHFHDKHGRMLDASSAINKGRCFFAAHEAPDD